MPVNVPPVPEAQEVTAEQEHLGLMWPDCIGGRPKLDLLQEEEEEEVEDHHLPHWNALEEQIQMTTQQPVSLVEAAGTGDAGRWKEGWHQQD